MMADASPFLWKQMSQLRSDPAPIGPAFMLFPWRTTRHPFICQFVDIRWSEVSQKATRLLYVFLAEIVQFKVI